MLPRNKYINRFIISAMMLLFTQITVRAQSTPPTWWFGVSGAANMNWYDGTTQRLNSSLIVPTAFHKGFGVRPYGSVLVEYRPKSLLGVSLNVAYDGRGGKFDGVVAPCNCPATLETTTSYIAVEPALRLTIPATYFYIFAGPRVAFNIQNSFEYTQVKQPNTNDNLSGFQETVFSGQVGAGYDLPISAKKSTTKVTLSPFVSFHPYFGQAPRNIESWNITTLRVGLALKFGKSPKDKIIPKIVDNVVVPDREVVFTVRGPKAAPQKREVSETLPLLNIVFFDEGSTAIPSRYITLNTDQANGFKEVQLQKEPTENMSGRSAHQLYVYHNILNVLGDRMRANPGTTITLVGSSGSGAKDGKAIAESVKLYLVTSFGIDGARIVTESRTKPTLPSEQPGSTKQLTMLRAEDRRVNIVSASPALFFEIGGGMMPSEQINTSQTDPMDNQVVFNVDGGADLLKTWSVTTTDQNGLTQNYGPYTGDIGSEPGMKILGDHPEGDYKITLTGTTKKDKPVKMNATVHLVKPNEVIEKGLRYSITFDFDKATTIASYQKFLTNVVTPLITDGSTVIIHGHTDVIGDDAYNQKLSENRARETQEIIERALTGLGRNNVKFETLGFGASAEHAPFENGLPEERFYNRTVIIDIIPVK